MSSDEESGTVKLYKYLKPERIDVLTKCKIRYTQPRAFNDPFELTVPMTRIMEEEEIKHMGDQLIPQQAQDVYERLPDPSRSLTSAQQVQLILKKRRAKRKVDKRVAQQLRLVAPEIRAGIEEALNSNIGILSLTERPDNLLMWAHYAASHEGLAIGFNSEHPYFNAPKSPNDELRHLRQVTYRQSRPKMSMTNFSGIDILLVKSTHWAYEREWRILRALQDADEVIPLLPPLHTVHLFNFPSDAVVEVILGCRMGEAKRKEVIKEIRSIEHFRHVRILQSSPAPLEFRLRFEHISA